MKFYKHPLLISTYMIKNHIKTGREQSFYRVKDIFQKLPVKQMIHRLLNK
ncbi:MAG: hypothetical protein K0S23_195 [Fluviicola sp.]|jgi:hypothetical protein|nr:hypothetical protein [Fluviicola sp.]